MLQGWISDSEKTVPTPVPQPVAVAAPQPSQPAQPINRSPGRFISKSNKFISSVGCFVFVLVARAVHDEQIASTNRQPNSGNTASLPSRSFRYLQEQYKNGNADDPNAVIATTTTVEETVVTGEGIGLRRGSASHMPSRAFKLLQDQYHGPQGPTNRAAAINNREDLAEIYNRRKMKTRT
jgi:hypothetical protein